MPEICGAREHRRKFENLFLCDHLIVTDFDDRFQIFLSFFCYDFSSENFRVLNFSLLNDGSNDDWKFLNF